jgi:integrase
MNLRTPAYRLHKPTRQAVVTIDDRDFYLGTYATEASRAEYDRLVSEWLSNGRRLPVSGGGDLTINEMLLAYLRFAKGYYQQSAELPNIRFAIRQLKRLYGHTLAAKFGPLALKSVREEMIRDDLCRNEVNKRIRRIVRAFKWAVESELIPPAIYQSLKAVPGLRYGRSEARESEPVKPVPEAFVEAVKPHVLPPVWAMIELQRLTAMRPGEVTAMRGCEMNMSGKVWTYEPPRHKAAHLGHRRTIFIGPKAQAVLRAWLRTDLEANLFSPREAVEALQNAESA